jgi:hypothetical protein
MKAGLAAIAAGQSAAGAALPPPELSAILGYADYEEKAVRFRAQG